MVIINICIPHVGVQLSCSTVRICCPGYGYGRIRLGCGSSHGLELWCMVSSYTRAMARFRVMDNSSGKG